MRLLYFSLCKFRDKKFKTELQEKQILSKGEFTLQQRPPGVIHCFESSQLLDAIGGSAVHDSVHHTAHFLVF